MGIPYKYGKEDDEWFSTLLNVRGNVHRNNWK
jgi:hypothetical protein